MAITPTTFDVILLNLLAQLQAVTGFPPERCGVSQDESREEYAPQAEQFLIVRCGPQRPDREAVVSRGRTDPVFTRSVKVVLWTRLNLDETQRDLSHLTDTTLGHFVFESKLWDALLCYEPTDAGGNWLVTEPIKPGPCSEPIKGRGPPAGWLVSGVEFEVSYVMLLPTAKGSNLD